MFAQGTYLDFIDRCLEEMKRLRKDNNEGEDSRVWRLTNTTLSEFKFVDTLRTPR